MTQGFIGHTLNMVLALWQMFTSIQQLSVYENTALRMGHSSGSGPMHIIVSCEISASSIGGEHMCIPAWNGDE